MTLSFLIPLSTKKPLQRFFFLFSFLFSLFSFSFLFLFSFLSLSSFSFLQFFPLHSFQPPFQDGTPLAVACTQKQKNVVDVLLAHDVDVNSGDMVPLSLPLFPFLLYSSSFPLLFSSYSPPLFSLFYFLKYGWTPLMQASSCGEKDIVSALLSKNACVDAEDEVFFFFFFFFFFSFSFSSYFLYFLPSPSLFLLHPFTHSFLSGRRNSSSPRMCQRSHRGCPSPHFSWCKHP